MPTCDVNEQHWPCLSPSVGKSRLSSHLALDARPRLGAFVSPWWPHPARSPGPGPAPLCTPQWFCLVLFFRKLGEILRTHTHTQPLWACGSVAHGVITGTGSALPHSWSWPGSRRQEGTRGALRGWGGAAGPGQAGERGFGPWVQRPTWPSTLLPFSSSGAGSGARALGLCRLRDDPTVLGLLILRASGKDGLQGGGHPHLLAQGAGAAQPPGLGVQSCHGSLGDAHCHCSVWVPQQASAHLCRVPWGTPFHFPLPGTCSIKLLWSWCQPLSHCRAEASRSHSHRAQCLSPGSPGSLSQGTAT